MATAKKSGLPVKAGTASRKAPVRKAATPVTKARAPVAKKAMTPTAPVKNQTIKPRAATASEKPEKVKKPKLVRDSFTIPKAEYVVLDELKQRAAKLTQPVKKSELLRAGIKALAAMQDAAFLTALANVPAIKTGRPTKSS
ncbi:MULTISPECIES: hypothetical protein [unclassified Polaromonas]|jgi:hypothetical protein|uniref:hypothetical protein n=2 Tax=Polaromonas TaxID=52972 RepID=UPI000BC7C352|nr:MULTISPECIES: hypothetical protein [unclassified Polaromonas]OYY37028.1 MAG: hypothetical protein B7Y60_08635 [Polaromonas sp. 35-63-35]OYZ20648.1 MAG: hypothetical protein B7Y28_08430 [Polaromonas sp. 16-63-31]OYZ78788.1 MAG: hypothetical protein B7Y09_10905 [Polaromonas sp. 24-63-21]OZA49700.1 MAG: hypothetical protein B7X88_14930 [Polaromonas sp. 17-63-33]OZA89131.1 MAG: hypothetical protein B7X65_05740 [Polaromonas sp. 39-63-25]